MVQLKERQPRQQTVAHGRDKRVWGSLKRSATLLAVCSENAELFHCDANAVEVAGRGRVGTQRGWEKREGETGTKREDGMRWVGTIIYINRKGLVSGLGT